MYEKYLGIPFNAGGDLGKGLNCWELVRLYYIKELSIQLPDMLLNSNNIKGLVKEFKNSSEYTNWREIPFPEKHDVVLLTHTNTPHHIGIYIEDGCILHSVEGVGVILSDKDNLQDLGFRILSYWRNNNA